MTREQQLALIREKCIAVNPSRVWWSADGPEEGNAAIWEPVRLADVLLAIGDRERIHVGGRGRFFTFKGDDMRDMVGGRFWNLRKDDLTEQSDECLAFLAELLQ